MGGLLGVHIYLQAYAFAPGVNPLQIIISNGVHWVLGEHLTGGRPLHRLRVAG